MTTQTTLVRLFTTAAAAAILAGCASQEQGSVASIPYHPKPGKGLVIVYRNETSLMREGWVGRIVNFRHIYDNTQDMGKLAGGTFILDDATPGRHSFTANDEEKKVEINVEAGKTYFIHADLHAGMWTPSQVIEQVEWREGAPAVLRLHKAEPARE